MCSLYTLQADNGASRHNLQARFGPSACDFEAIFNAYMTLVSQPRQFSVVVLRAYSSSTTSSLCVREIIAFLPLFDKIRFGVTKNPCISGVLATLLLPLILRQLQEFRRNWHPFSRQCEGVVGFHRAGPSTHLDESRYLSYLRLVFNCTCVLVL